MASTSPSKDEVQRCQTNSLTTLLKDNGSGSSTGSLSSHKKRRKDLFGDCALVELIHLHDCLRGALRELQSDVTELSRTVLTFSSVVSSSSSSSSSSGGGGIDPQQERISELEGRVAGRFQVIWSVFRAHSAAEDEFIWPALKSKQNDLKSCNESKDEQHVNAPLAQNEEPQNEGDQQSPRIIEQEEYEEDHADEERMFLSMDSMLSKLRAGLSVQRMRGSTSVSSSSTHQDAPSKKIAADLTADSNASIREMALAIDGLTSQISKHLLEHLEKEETHCMPLVRKHLTNSEITDLVGQIMGKRSSDLMSQILTMAVQNLNETDREEMVHYMKQAMVGTFFERWLTMGGWMAPLGGDRPTNGTEGGSINMIDKIPVPMKNDSSSSIKSQSSNPLVLQKADISDLRDKSKADTTEGATSSICESVGRSEQFSSQSIEETSLLTSVPANITSQVELEKLIRAIASNPELTTMQKTTTIQGLRDSVWKSNIRLTKRKRDDGDTDREGEKVIDGTTITGNPPFCGGHDMGPRPASAATATRSRRVTPPSAYYKKNRDGIVELLWSSDSPSAQFPTDDRSVPLFSASELAPTFHDGATAAVLGCPHYARSCKLRHPSSGRLYTCRLCCEQEREMPMKQQDSPLDRYAVTEVLCMRCGALQPAGAHCINQKCESQGKPYAKYSCRICNLYDDEKDKVIYHCPFCNVCRSGIGLGIDYRHCMRCNACVSLADDRHHCIPQRLQGNCPICHESMFESTEPLRGLKCGHVMHLSCFGMYMRGQSYTCPLCKKSVEDMKEYFTLLDAAVRMQPMPAAYTATMSNIYCQDCCQIGKVQYHFVGCKCTNCGSYNTRELGREEESRGGR